jgi:hypothetical protein
MNVGIRATVRIPFPFIFVHSRFFLS